LTQFVQLAHLQVVIADYDHFVTLGGYMGVAGPEKLKKKTHNDQGTGTTSIVGKLLRADVTEKFGGNTQEASRPGSVYASTPDVPGCG
jgi:hypothetical protein